MAVMRPQEFFLYALRRVSSAEVSPRWLTLCFLFGLLTSALSAQVNTGNLSGTIRDSSGAVVQRAHLHISEVRTGYERQVDSATDGSYTFVDLPIGSYTLQVSANGFSTLRQGVTISVGARVRSDLQLAVNGSAETVSVVATASSLSRDDASISTLIPLETIQNTPLYLRNWDDLLRNVPGVQINRYTNQGGATSSGRTGSFNVNGVHSMQNNFILDGIDNNTFSENVQELSTESAHPSVDVIAEFNVITNPYSAEYGRAPGAVVSVNTRSGTNHLHGTAYEYLRNDYFDAFDYFTKETTNPKKAKNHQNQFGGSLGGPILSNRAFYYFNYEGTRIAQGITRTSTVPLDNERSGNFSAAAAALAGVAPYATIYDPLTCATAYTIDSTCTQFSDGGVANKIPQKRIDTSVARLIALFPEPNFKNGQANYPETNNYFRTGNLTDQNDSYDARVDLALSSNDTVFVRFNDYTRSTSTS